MPAIVRAPADTPTALPAPLGRLGCKGQETSASVARSGDLNDHFDLDRHTERQLEDTDRAAGVLAGLPEDVDQELAGPVDHTGLAGETFGRGDEADHLDDPHDPLQAD